MSGDFSLDTAGFDLAIKNARSMAETMRTLKNTIDSAKSNLMFSWGGAGANTFEKKYRLFSQQFGDLKDDLYEIAENLLEIEEKYIQADTDAAKSIEGKSSRY